MVNIILVVIAFVSKVFPFLPRRKIYLAKLRSEEFKPIYRCRAVDYKESLIISNDQTWIGVRVRRIPATEGRQNF